MSAILFHTKNHPTVRVSGAERGLLGQLCSDALIYTLGSSIEFWGDGPPKIMEHIPSKCYLHKHCQEGHGDLRAIKTWLRVAGGNDAKLILNGEEYPLFDLQLNSAMALGGDAFKLAARLHGQCEIHCYVEGPNREWLASIIQSAMDQHIYRKDMGWEECIDILRKENDQPVVCSYTVCEQFPNRGVAEWEPPEGQDGDAWYDLPEDEQWDMAMEKLRANRRSGLEITPEYWEDYFFGKAPVSGFHFRNA